MAYIKTLSYGKQIEAIKNDVRKTVSKITADLANKANKDMQKVFNTIIQNYYYSYTEQTHKPLYYHRTYNLYNMVVPQPIDEVGRYGHSATLRVTCMFMNDNYNISPQNVYDLVWNMGFRGVPYKFEEWQEWDPEVKIEGGETITLDNPHELMILYLEKWKDIGAKYAHNLIYKYGSSSPRKAKQFLYY